MQPIGSGATSTKRSIKAAPGSLGSTQDYVNRIRPPATGWKGALGRPSPKPSRSSGRGQCATYSRANEGPLPHHSKPSASSTCLKHPLWASFETFVAVPALPNFCDRRRGQNLLGSVTYRAIGVFVTECLIFTGISGTEVQKIESVAGGPAATTEILSERTHKAEAERRGHRVAEQARAGAARPVSCSAIRRS
jgi:hypothetical protein